MKEAVTRLMTKTGKAEKQNNQVRNQLIAMMMVMMVIPVVVLGYLNYLQAHKALYEKMSEAAVQTTSLAKATLLEYFTGVEYLIDVASGNPQLMALARGVSASQTEMTEIPEEGAPSAEAAEVQPEAAEVPVVQAPDISLLESIFNANPDMMHVYMATLEKETYIYPQVDLGPDFDPTTRPWYIEAVSRAGEVVWTDPYIDTNTKEITITAAKALVENGKVIGVVGLDLDLEQLVERVNGIQLGETGYVVLTNAGGVVISYPDFERIGSDFITQESYWETVSVQEEGFLSYRSEGLEKFMSFTTLPGKGWKLMGAMEEKELSGSTGRIAAYTFGGIIIAALTGFTVALLLAKKILAPLNQIRLTLREATQGNLSVKYQFKGNDEFGELGRGFNEMIGNMKELVENIQVSSQTVVETSSSLASITDQTSAATNEIALTIEEISRSAEEQAKDTEAGVLKVNELSAQIEEVLESTNELKGSADAASQLSQQGLTIVETLILKNKETENASTRIEGAITSLNESVNTITHITHTISEIAGQTNLLALNAAIEAARAGEYGRGFSVVAEEIRKLAEQSAKSTGQINQLIESVQNQSGQVVKTMSGMHLVMDEQTRAVQTTQGIFNQITSSVSEVDERAMLVKIYADEMAHKKDEIVATIENISATAQQTSAATEEISAGTEEQLAATEEVSAHAKELQALAEGLQAVISLLNVEDDGPDDSLNATQLNHIEAIPDFNEFLPDESENSSSWEAENTSITEETKLESGFDSADAQLGAGDEAENQEEQE